jgi:hypothetical protein
VRFPQESGPPPIRLEAISPLGGIRGTDRFFDPSENIQPPN